MTMRNFISFQTGEAVAKKEETKIGYDDSKKLIQIGNPKPVTDSKEETSSGETDDGSGEALQEVDVIE